MDMDMDMEKEKKKESINQTGFTVMMRSMMGFGIFTLSGQACLSCQPMNETAMEVVYSRQSLQCRIADPTQGYDYRHRPHCLATTLMHSMSVILWPITIIQLCCDTLLQVFDE